MNDELRRRIAALLHKARDVGASEAEALVAAERAARLLAEAGLTEDDVEYDEDQAALGTKRPTVRDQLWGVVAICTNCAAITDRDWTPVIIFIGRAPGPQIAVYLVDLLRRAIDREVEGFKTSPEYKRRRTLATRRAAVQDFTNGLVVRLRLRLLDLFAASIDDAAREQARHVLDQRFPQSKPGKMPSHRTRFGSAAGAGYAAGGKVQIARGVTGGQAVKRIGGPA